MYFGAVTTPCSLGWVQSFAARMQDVYPSSPIVLTTEEADAVADRALAGTLRGSAELNHLLYGMFPAPFERPATAENTVAFAIEEIVVAKCPPVDTSMKPPAKDDGSSSLRAANSSALPVIALVAIAYVVLS